MCVSKYVNGQYSYLSAHLSHQLSYVLRWLQLAWEPADGVLSPGSAGKLCSPWKPFSSSLSSGQRQQCPGRASSAQLHALSCIKNLIKLRASKWREVIGFAALAAGQPSNLIRLPLWVQLQRWLREFSLFFFPSLGQFVGVKHKLRRPWTRARVVHIGQIWDFPWVAV